MAAWKSCLQTLLFLLNWNIRGWIGFQEALEYWTWGKMTISETGGRWGPSSPPGTQDKRCSGPPRDCGHVSQWGQLLCGINSLASVNWLWAEVTHVISVQKLSSHASSMAFSLFTMRMVCPRWDCPSAWITYRRWYVEQRCNKPYKIQRK